MGELEGLLFDFICTWVNSIADLLVMKDKI